MRSLAVLIALLSGIPRQGHAQDSASRAPAGSDTAQRLQTPYAIGRLSARELGAVIATSLLGGLRGRMAGVRAIAPSGEPGTELRLRLRGATAITGDQDPLIIIDGTIIRGSLADLPADDVERIEVLKGPSAAAVYGSDGAAGVVLVFTRRGKAGPEGKLQIRLRSEAGPSFMTARFGESGAHPFEITTGPGGAVDFVRNSSGARVLTADHIADNPYPVYYDHQSQLYGTGLFFANHLSVAGRKRGTNFAASVDNTRDEGTVSALSGWQRRNLRLNGDQRLGPVDLALSGFYATSDRQLPPQGTGTFFGIRFLEPQVDLLASNPDGSPYRIAIPDRIGNASNPLNALANQKVTAEGKRLIASGTLRWHPTRWLVFEGSHHLEREDLDSATQLPPRSQPPQPGFLTHEFSTGRSRNTDAAVLASREWGRVSGAVRLGYTYETRSVDDSATVGGLGENPEKVSSSHTEANVKSWYGTTGLVFEDRYVLDAAVRRDEMSLLAPRSRTRWYYRVAGAWRADQDLRLGALDDLTLHLAYGTAGQRPGFALGFLPLITGLDPLRAPRSGELELGASLATRGGRFTLNYAYSRKTTRDVIELGSIQTSVGFIDVPLNAGTIRATTHELTLGYTVFRRPEVAWSLTLTGDRIRQRITEYSLPERLLSFASQQPGIFFVGAGKTLGVMYGTRFVRTIAELYDDPDKQALSGPGQAFDPANFVVNEEGYVVAKASWRCGEDHLYRDGAGACATPERPIPYETVACPAVTCPPGQLVPIGNSTPDFVAGLQSTLRYKRFELTSLLEWNQGGDVYNGSRQWPFLEQRDPLFDQRGKPEAEKKSIEYYRAFYNGLNGSALFVESGTYLKVREVALTCTFRLGALERVSVGLVGRNLFTLTGYSGYDPEVGNTADPFLGRVDWFQYPHYRTISGLVEIAF
jgi:TonB-dependent SusC/RagA subfamily outer membrane receptor